MFRGHQGESHLPQYDAMVSGRPPGGGWDVGGRLGLIPLDGSVVHWPMVFVKSGVPSIHGLFMDVFSAFLKVNVGIFVGKQGS